MTDYKIVRVEWVDSYYCCKQWSPMESVIDEINVNHCISVGFLIADKDDCICVVADIDDIYSNQHNVSGGTVIPKCAIIGMKEMEEKK